MAKSRRRGAYKGRRRWRVKNLIRKHRGRCAYCEELVNLTHLDPKQATVDHIIPRGKGGADQMTNLQLLCRQCNLDKGCTLLDDDGEILEDDDL